jgi:hypothetical protein
VVSLKTFHIRVEYANGRVKPLNGKKYTITITPGKSKRMDESEEYLYDGLSKADGKNVNGLNIKVRIVINRTKQLNTLWELC